MYAAGKIPGSFFKREGRAGEKGTLTARMIDRPIRPLFPKGWRYETQLVAIPLSDRPRPPVRHPCDERRVRGADDLRHPAAHARRRGAHRQDRRQLRRQPRRGGPPREHRPRPDRGRHRGRHPHGRGGRQRDLRGRDPRRARHRPRRDQEALRRPARAGREGRQGEARHRGARRSTRTCSSARSARRHGAALDAATQVEDKLERQDATKAVEEAVLEQYSGDPDADTYARVPPAAPSSAFDKLEKAIIRQRIAIHKKRPDGRARDARSAPIYDRGRRRSAHARLRALHAWPDAGAQRRRPRHAEGGDAPRHARARDPEVLLAPLQLPALLGGRGGLHARPQAPRHRPRRARRAGAGAGGPDDRGLPVHDSRRVGHPRVQRLVVDGLGLRLVAVADGRRRADQARRSPASRWASSRRATTTPSSPTSPASRTTSATWTSRSPAPSEGITALQMDIKITGVTFDILRDALAQAHEARLDILGKMAEVIAGPREQLSPHAPRIVSVEIDPSQDRPAHRQGRRDDPRPAGASSSRRSTSTTTARCSSTPPTASWARRWPSASGR